MLWTHASTMVPAFADRTLADLPVPCTYDFSVAMTKYFDALDDGEVPLSLLFSGTIFYKGPTQALQAAPISWDKEASYRLPVATWRRMMEQYYPNAVALSVHKDVFDRLHRFKVSAGHITWEQAIEDLLESAESKAVP
jgi:hypothetical protein